MILVPVVVCFELYIDVVKFVDSSIRFGFYQFLLLESGLEE